MKRGYKVKIETNRYLDGSTSYDIRVLSPFNGWSCPVTVSNNYSLARRIAAMLRADLVN